ncbi:MAG TPA: OmpA family protein [Gammaproteobacteria bacterium]|nr:OmpA family protein [Gammaproteobacteria bacterium]
MKRAMPTLAFVAIAALLAASAPALARGPDLDFQRLSASLDHLAADPVLGQYALGQQARARDSLQRLKAADDDERTHFLYLAERRVDLAYASAQLQHAQQQFAQLQHEHDQIMLQASQQDAERTRRQLERERVQGMAAAEAARRLREQGQLYSQQAEQARAEAEKAKALAAAQARAAALSQKEAKVAEAAVAAMRSQLDHLKATQGREGMQMTLGDTAFAPGQSNLRPQARSHLGKLVQFVQSKPNQAIRIEGYTDSSGSTATNKTLSRQRAESVRDALVAAGVDAKRITVVGEGESNPVASNATADGRARNRRVVVILRK